VPVTALIVRVAEAEPVVASLRARFDATASLGVPAHITVLFPFMPPELVSGDVLIKLRRVLGQQSPFEFGLTGIGRLAKTTYLKPTPAEPFVRMTQSVTGVFPGYRPYQGQHPDIVPHLTVAHGDERNAAIAESELRASPAGSTPIASVCRQVELLENSTQSWRTMHVFSLATK
jgi:2'-5' RNA ligase